MLYLTFLLNFFHRGSHLVHTEMTIGLEQVKIRNERKDITTDASEIKIIGDCYEQYMRINWIT